MSRKFRTTNFFIPGPKKTVEELRRERLKKSGIREIEVIHRPLSYKECDNIIDETKNIPVVWTKSQLLNLKDGSILREAGNGSKVRLRWVEPKIALALDKYSRGDVLTHSQFGFIDLRNLNDRDLLVINKMEEWYIETNASKSTLKFLKLGIKIPKRTYCKTGALLIGILTDLWKKEEGTDKLNYHPLTRLKNSIIMFADGRKFKGGNQIDQLRVTETLIINVPYWNGNEWCLEGRLMDSERIDGMPWNLSYYRIEPVDDLITVANRHMRRQENNK